MTHPLPVPSSAWWEEALGRREVGVDTSADLSSGSRSGGPLRYSCVPCRVLLNILNSLPWLKKARDFPSKFVFWLLMTDCLELSGSCLRRWGTRSSKPQAPPGPPQFHPLPGPVAACMLVTHSLGRLAASPASMGPAWVCVCQEEGIPCLNSHKGATWVNTVLGPLWALVFAAQSSQALPQPPGTSNARV